MRSVYCHSQNHAEVFVPLFQCCIHKLHPESVGSPGKRKVKKKNLCYFSFFHSSGSWIVRDLAGYKSFCTWSWVLVHVLYLELGLCLCASALVQETIPELNN